MRDILERLRRDAGQLTLAELIQEREAAACEIERLRNQHQQVVAVTPRSHARIGSAVMPPTSDPVIGKPRSLQLGALVRLKDVSRFVGLSRTTIYNRISQGTFPPPVKLSDHCVRWRFEDLEAWIRDPRPPTS